MDKFSRFKRMPKIEYHVDNITLLKVQLKLACRKSSFSILKDYINCNILIKKRKKSYKNSDFYYL